MRMIAMPNGHVRRIALQGSISIIVQQAGLTAEMGIVHQLALARVYHHTNSMQCQFLRKRSLHLCVDLNGRVVPRVTRITMRLAQQVGPALALSAWALAHMRVNATSVLQREG